MQEGEIAKPINFNPRAPCGARRAWALTATTTPRFQSTRPVRGATRRMRRERMMKPFQSTRPVRGATFHLRFWIALKRGAFQSTRPVRGATNMPECGHERITHFNPRAPCGARRSFVRRLPSGSAFQSTRPVRGATSRCRPSRKKQTFQSTRPVRGATATLNNIKYRSLISIHAPRAGRDYSALKLP